MNIRFTSSLTPEDENAFAPVIIQALAGILDLLPIAYMIRIDTSDAKVYQHVGSQQGPRQSRNVPARERPAPMGEGESHRYSSSARRDG